jgi:hypothetical protein
MLDFSEVSGHQFRGPMAAAQTAHNLTESGNGEWTLAGVWVINDFLAVTHTARSPLFEIRDDISLYLALLNPLNHHGIRVTLIVLFTSLPDNYPMDLQACLLNSRHSGNLIKTSHVTYSTTALRSYINFDVKWHDITDSSGFLDEGRLRIEFRFHHSLTPYQGPPTLTSFPTAVFPQQMRSSLSLRDRTGAIGIQTVAGEDCLNSLLIILFHIPHFRATLFRIRAVTWAGTNHVVALLQKVFSDLQLRHDAADSRGFVRAIGGAPTAPRDALSAILLPVRAALGGDRFFDQFCVVSGPSYRTIGIELNVDGESFDAMVRRFGRQIAGLDELPDVLFVFLARERTTNLELPTEFNFNVVRVNAPRDTWDLQSLLVYSGRSDGGVFYANVRRDPRSPWWLEFRSSQVLEIAADRALNGSGSVMLVYTRRSQAATIFQDVPERDIPERTSASFGIHVITESDFEVNVLRGELGCGTQSKFSIPIHPNETFRSFLQIVANQLKADPASLRMWSVSADGTLQTIIPLDACCEVIRQCPFVFVEHCSSQTAASVAENQIVVFAKFFRPHFPIQLLGSVRIGVEAPIKQLFRTVSQLLESDCASYWVYRETQDYSAIRLCDTDSMRRSGITSGQSLIFQCPPGFEGFAAKFQFKEALPRLGPPPHFAQCELTDISDDTIAIDVTAEDDIGSEFQQKILTVDEFLDFHYHLVVLGVALVGSDLPAQFYFRVPMSVQLEHLEEFIGATVGLMPPLKFFMQNEADEGREERPVNREVENSLRKDILRIRGFDTRPIIVYVEGEPA